MIRTVTKAGQPFHVDDERHSQFWDWFESASWEPDTVEALRLYLDRETVYVDVGAWIGDTVMLAAQRARAVVAFEPDPVARADLVRNLGLNPGIRNVEVRPEALSDRGGTARLGSAGEAGDSLGQLVGDARPGGASTAEVVNLLNAQEFVNTSRYFPPGDTALLKLDVEGSEYEIVPAIRKFLREARPHLLVSFHPNLRYQKKGVVPRISSGLRILLANWKMLLSVKSYKYHLAWEPDAKTFINKRRINIGRMLLPLPMRSSLLIGTYLFTQEQRSPR